jgi:hypothetical protein
MRWNVLVAALLAAGMVSAQTTTGTTSSGTTDGAGAIAGATPTSTTSLSAGQMRVAGRVAAPFATIAGSSDNAVALATALRTGTVATLNSTSTASDGTTTTTSTTITPPTKPMGWGNVSHSLALAQVALTKAGVTQPTNADLQAALIGGDAVGADGKTVTLTGVLQQRAGGMGWGGIAASYGTTMGAVNRALHAPMTSAVTASGGTVTAASGTTAKAATTGIVTATSASGNAGGRGLTTASGSVGSGVANAGGNGNAFGRGIVTASGGAAVAGTAGVHGRSTGVMTASGGGALNSARGGGNDHGNSQGRGKGGG